MYKNITHKGYKVHKQCFEYLKDFNFVNFHWNYQPFFLISLVYISFYLVKIIIKTPITINNIDDTYSYHSSAKNSEVRATIIIKKLRKIPTVTYPHLPFLLRCCQKYHKNCCIHIQNTFREISLSIFLQTL